MAACGIQFPVLIAEALETISAPDIPPAAVLWPRFIHPPGLIVLTTNGYATGMDTTPANITLLAEYSTIAQQLQLGDLLPSHEVAVIARTVGTWLKRESVEVFNVPEQPEHEFGLFNADLLFSELPTNGGPYFIVPIEGVPFPMATNPIQTASVPGPNGTTQGLLILRGEQIATYATRSKARTAARYLNKFLSRLPPALEVSLDAMQAGMSAYLADAAFG